MASITFRDTKGNEYTAQEAPAALLRAAEKSEKASPAARAAAEAELNRRAELGGDEPEPEVIKAPAKPPAATALARIDHNSLNLTTSDAPTVNAFLARIEDQVNLLTPSMMFSKLPDGFEVQITTLAVNTKLDCINIEGKLMLSADKLKSFKSMLGLWWKTGLKAGEQGEWTREIPTGEKWHWKWTAVAFYRDTDGQIKECMGSYELDLTEESARVTSGKFSEKQIAGMRSSGCMLCETGAKSRAIVDYGIKRSRSEAEWSKPFTCVRLIERRPIEESKNLLYPKPIDIPADDPSGPDGSEVES